MIEERFLLAKERIGAVEKEAVLEQRFQAYFGKTAAFLGMVCEEYEWIAAALTLKKN